MEREAREGASQFEGKGRGEETRKGEKKRHERVRRGVKMVVKRRT
jgi:hypothetical protein